MLTMTEEPRFLVDGMLGRLAKWLRVLGYDTAYFPRLDDNQLVRLARAEGRTLLTRDTGLARRRGVKHLLIEDDELEKQLGQVFRHLGLTTERTFSRCPVCNTPLRPVDKASIEGRVPPYVYRTQERFSLCPSCDKVYWRGTHWERMKEKLDRLRGEGRLGERV